MTAHPMAVPLNDAGALVWRGWVERIIDGDTLVVLLDRGFDDRSLKSIRLRGLDTSELRDRDPDERWRGKLARDYLATLAPPGTPVEVWTYRKSFERYVGDVWRWWPVTVGSEQVPAMRDPLSLAEHMAANGMAKGGAPAVSP